MTTVLDELGETVIFAKQILQYILKNKIRFHLVVEQIWKVSLQSLPTTALAGFFVGAVMAIQFSMQVKEFDAVGFLGGLATSGTLREVGPLLIAFMLSGKVGAFTSAELGTMRVTEQIDAIRCLGADPMTEIIVPRFIGIIISSFFLLVIGLLLSIVGGALVTRLYIGLNPEEYIRHIPTIVNSYSILSGVVKCFMFSFLLATICTFKGFNATGGAQGVGRAVISTAVTTMVGLVLMDWFTSFLLNKILLILEIT